jgi:acyl-CoA synthetase (NDP forming)
MTHPLAEVFRPRSIALVGASEKSVYAQSVFRNLRLYGYEGEVHAVNRRGAAFNELPGFVSCQAIGKQIDSAFLLVPATGVLEALIDAIAAGARSAVLLASGFAETGPDGAALQNEVVKLADANAIRVFGPNCLGFVDLVARVPVTPLAAFLPLIEGSVGLVCQSGATASEIMQLAHRHSIGLSFAAATGNEAQIAVADVIDYLVSDPATRAIAVFAETIRHTDRFVAAANRAREARKPIVILKVGASELAAKVARAHTGSLVGNDQVFDAVCEQLGVIRVRTLEDLTLTAGLLDRTGPIEGGALGFVSTSGGACTLIADHAAALKLPLPEFAPQTIEALRTALPTYASALNPLDITGAAMADASIATRCIEAVGRDPAIKRVFMVYDLPYAADRVTGVDLYRAIGAGLAACQPSGLLVTQTIKPVNDVGREVLAQAGIPGVVCGIDATMRALSRGAWWSSRLGPESTGSDSAPATRFAPWTGARPRSERETMNVLTACGVVVIPTRLASTAAEAVCAAREFPGPVALKVNSPDIAHKTDVGGVKLSLSGDTAVRNAFKSIIGSVRVTRPDAQIDGVLVSPMRDGGVELFVGTMRDPSWGPVLIVALGGIWVEVLKDTAMTPLPATAATVRRLLEGLRGAKLLVGYRGAPTVDLDALARQIARIGDVALALGPDLVSLEINPLLATPKCIEALDALAVWA